MTTDIQEPPAAEAPALPQTAPPPFIEAAAAQPRRKRSRWPWLLVLGGLALIVYFFVHRGSQQQAAAGGKAGAQAAPHAVPVLAAAARRGDMPVYLTGLGTAASASTVTVRSRVDGQLIRVDFREGQAVHAGDLLAELDPRPFQVQLMQAEGQLAKDEAALKNAQLDLQRYQVLAQEDSIPKQQLDTQMATVNQDEGAIKTDQGNVASARLNLSYCRIAAPAAGRIGLRLVDPGNIVHASDANGLLVITQVQPIVVIFTVAADSLPQVQQQLAAGRTLPVDAYDRDLRNKLATGTLLAVDNQIDQSTGTVRLKAVFPNLDNALFPNQFVNARLLVDTLHGATILPTAAIQRSPQSTFVYVVKPDNSVENRDVDVALTEGDNSAVRSGVTPGETVVTDGLDKLQPGMKVSIGSAAPGTGAPGKGAPGAKGAPGSRSKRAPGTASPSAARGAPGSSSALPQGTGSSQGTGGTGSGTGH
jgi:multidrug efflux system membrane fusion protein